MNTTTIKAKTSSTAVPEVDPNFPKKGDRVSFLQVPRSGAPVWHQGRIALNNGREIAIDVDTGGRFNCPRRYWQERLKFHDRPDPDFCKDYYI
ncbi:MAG: hypothetical protein HC916_21635 [Coleofasciculaceae cyanobacterium SM2_1_6]|nr:hypothetical protein [Coleofasciculaceae cyanobacterium SM2_1_6]